MALSDPTKDFAWGSETLNPDFPDPAAFLGDYSGIAVVPGTNQIAALWTDMREQVTSGSWVQDAYFALVETPEALNAAAAVTPNAASEANWLIAVDDLFTELSSKKRK